MYGTYRESGVRDNQNCIWKLKRNLGQVREKSEGHWHTDGIDKVNWGAYTK